MATLHELRTIYTYADLFYLNEVLDLRQEAEYLRNKKDA